MSAILTPLPSSDPRAVQQQKPVPSPLAPLLFSEFVPPGSRSSAQARVPGLAALPSWSAYAELEATDFPSCWPKPLSLLPAMDQATPPPFIPVASLIPDVEEEAAVAAMQETAASLPADYTDEDLFQAFAPIIESALRNTLDGHRSGIDPQLEPMLRATIRRALAEYSPGQRPFRAPGSFDRLLWRMQALFSSRSYDEIVFEKTHRFQVEEVFLLDVKTLALISFASCDPARHASAHRVQGTLQRLALQIRGEDGELRSQFTLPDQRTVVSRSGQHIILVAIVRGPANELITSDLDFSIQRIEDRFREELQKEGTPLLQTLQPFLEDCLLIQSPAHAA